MIGPAGDDRGDRRVAVIARAGRGDVLRRPARPVVPDRQAGAVQELVECEVKLQLDGLPGPVRQAPRSQQAAECLLERVVVTLDPASGVLRPGFLAQRLQYRGEGYGAAAGEVAVQPPGPAQRGGEPQRPVLETVIWLPVRAGGPPPDLLRQLRQVRQVRAAPRG